MYLSLSFSFSVSSFVHTRRLFSLRLVEYNKRQTHTLRRKRERERERERSTAAADAPLVFFFSAQAVLTLLAPLWLLAFVAQNSSWLHDDFLFLFFF